MNNPISAKVTLWTNRTIAAVLVILVFCMPFLLNWYRSVRLMERIPTNAILVAFYCCVPAVGAALWDLDKILRNILQGRIFVPANVNCIRRIRWYCLVVGVICFPAAFFYPPLIFISVIMGFLALVVCVVANAWRGAVELREENDLTI